MDELTKLHWGKDRAQMAAEDNLYELSRLADYYGENEGKIPILLGSKDGRFGFNKSTRSEFYKDTEVDWLDPYQARAGCVFGAQGAGKCIDGESLVFTKDGLEKAKDLSETEVNSLSQNSLKISLKKGFKVIKEKTPLLQFTTTRGYSISITPDHKFLTIVGWREAKDLRIGDYIAAANRWDVEVKPNQKLNLTDVRHTPIDVQLTPEFAYFVGCFLGDGSYSDKKHSRIVITTMSDEIKNSIIDVARLTGSNLGIDGINQFAFSNISVADFLKSHGAPSEGRIKGGVKGTKSARVFIHNIFLSADPHILAALLSGLFDTDGCVEKAGITLTTKSARLAHSLQMALLRFGITCFRRERKITYRGEPRKFHVISITEQDSRRLFSEQVGFKVKRKKDKLSAQIENFKSKNPNSDVIPITTELIEKLRNEIKPPFYIYSADGKHRKKTRFQYIRGWVKRKKASYPSREQIKSLIAELEPLSQRSPTLAYLRLLSDADLIWVKVKAIKYREAEVVYDFTIPETHNFIAEGLILHNTWVIQLITSQLASIDQHFGLKAQPAIMLDAAAEVTTQRFIHPQQNPKMLARLKPYFRYFPWLRPFSLAHKTHFIAPINYGEQLAARDVYDDQYISLKATDLQQLGNLHEAYQLTMELLNIKEDDPAARMVRRGMVELQKQNPHFVGMYGELLNAISEERDIRRTVSISQQARIMLGNFLHEGELEIGEDVDWRTHLKNRDLLVLHLPISQLGTRIYSVLFTVILGILMKAINEDCPPFSLYVEEAHKLVEDQNSVLARTFRDIYQLHRKSGRRVISVVRHPSYAKDLIWESDFILTPQMGANEAKLFLGYVPKKDIDFDIEELGVQFRDASQWLMAQKGDPEIKKFRPFPPSVDSGRQLG